MRKYWIDKVIITPEGEKMPKGFELYIGDNIAKIIVPSDLYRDINPCYEEEISLEEEQFKAIYEDENPVHIDDGEVIGMDLDEYRSSF